MNDPGMLFRLRGILFRRDLRLLSSDSLKNGPSAHDTVLNPSKNDPDSTVFNEIVTEAPVIATSRTIKCDGGGIGGHPTIYINLVPMNLC